MTDHVWWVCRTCGTEMYDSRAVHHHRSETGHNDAGLCTDQVPNTGPGSTDEGRARARRIWEDARKAARASLSPSQGAPGGTTTAERDGVPSQRKAESQ